MDYTTKRVLDLIVKVLEHVDARDQRGERDTGSAMRYRGDLIREARALIGGK